MIIKKKFSILKNVDNIIDFSESIINAYVSEDNDPRHVFIFLNLNKNKINHFTKDTIFKYISNVKERENLKVVNFDKYILPSTFNMSTKDIVINLKPFGVNEIASLDSRNFYSLLTYSYCFSEMIRGKLKISLDFSSSIINFLLSVFIRLFGKEYGLLGIYSGEINKLKFLLSCYIFCSFFGLSNNKDLYRKASSISSFNYTDISEQLSKYDFSDINDFIKSLSDFGVMKGLTQHKFASRVLKLLSINMLPALEDISRFISTILASNIPGVRFVPSFLFRYNEVEFNKILLLTKRIF